MRTKELIIRWSVLTSGLTALFWAVWWLVVGEVPTVTAIRLTRSYAYTLPWGISRWWDILASFVFGLCVGLVGGLVLGLWILAGRLAWTRLKAWLLED